MVARRLFVALVVALLFSGLFTWFLSTKLTRQSVAKNVPARKVVSVTRNIPAGEALEPSSLRLTDWTNTQTLAGAFDKVDGVSGRVLLVPLTAGEMVLAHDLATPGSGSGLMARVPSGMRALTLRVNEISGDTSFLIPGTVVDVLATYRPATEPGMVTSTVLQSVNVVAVGTNTEPAADAKATTTTPLTVTVLLSPLDAEKLTLAASLGKIAFVLRNGADRQPVAGLLTADSLVDGPVGAPQPGPSVMGVPRAVQVAADPRFTVETISGNKESEESFGSGGK